MVAINIVASRYGRSAFIAALELGKQDQVAKDFEKISSFLQTKGMDVLLATSAKVPARIKRNFWDRYCEFNKIEYIARNLIYLLVKNNRVEALGKIISVFHARCNEYKGIIGVDIISATVLSDALKAEVVKVMAEKLKAEVKPVYKVDSLVLGGIIVKVGSKQLDFSIGLKLREMKRKLEAKNIIN